MGDVKDRWLFVEDICKYLGGSNGTVYKWIDRGCMSSPFWGCLWKFEKEKVDASGAEDCNKKGSDE